MNSFALTNRNDDTSPETLQQIVSRIRESKLTIYDSIEHQPNLKFTASQLEALLSSYLHGLKLDQPIRTRSKVVKTAICSGLGYPTPESFRKTQPRFPGQDFDVYVQKSNNLQIWNEELAASRRYVLIRVDENDIVTKVRVVSGVQLEKLDTTGTLTSKHQAVAIAPESTSRLISPNDTTSVMTLRQQSPVNSFYSDLFPIDKLFVRLGALVGVTFDNPGSDQERNRGWALHQLVSRQLGIETPHDDGQVPDVTDQLLELKLQTSPTIDLGLAIPGSAEPLEGFPGLRLADIRYAIFFGDIADQQEKKTSKIRLEYFVMVTGADFFDHFKQLKGNTVNKKNQIRLPSSFFDQ